MATQDKCCTIVPYFKVSSGKLGAELVGVSIMLITVLGIPPALAGLLGAWIHRRYGSPVK